MNNLSFFPNLFLRSHSNSPTTSSGGTPTAVSRTVSSSTAHLALSSSPELDLVHLGRALSIEQLQQQQQQQPQMFQSTEFNANNQQQLSLNNTSVMVTSHNSEIPNSLAHEQKIGGELPLAQSHSIPLSALHHLPPSKSTPLPSVPTSTVPTTSAMAPISSTESVTEHSYNPVNNPRSSSWMMRRTNSLTNIINRTFSGLPPFSRSASSGFFARHARPPMADQTRTPEQKRTFTSKPTVNTTVATPTNITSPPATNQQQQQQQPPPTSPNYQTPLNHNQQNTTAASHLHTQSAPPKLSSTPTTTPNLRSSADFIIPKLSPSILHEILESPITEFDLSPSSKTTLTNNKNNNNNTQHHQNSHAHHDQPEEHRQTPNTHHHIGTEATISAHSSTFPSPKLTETHFLKSEMSPVPFNTNTNNSNDQQHSIQTQTQTLITTNNSITQHKPSILAYKTHQKNTMSMGNDQDWDISSAIPFNQDHTTTFPEAKSEAVTSPPYGSSMPALVRKTASNVSSMSTNPITNQALANQTQHTHSQPNNVFLQQQHSSDSTTTTATNSTSSSLNTTPPQQTLQQQQAQTQQDQNNLNFNSNTSQEDISLLRYQSSGSLSARGAVEMSVEQAELLKCFIPQEIGRRLEVNQHGWIFSELRTISVLFIRINDQKLKHPNGPSVEDLSTFFETVASHVNSLDGSIRQFLQDDKGIVCICVFGLIAHEDDELRAIHVKRKRV